MFRNFFKKRKIKKVARKLPRDLKAKYGHKKYYLKAQVDASMRRNNINYSDADNYYVYAMYCSRKNYNKINCNAEKCDYSAMRDEISDTLFNGVTTFSFSTLLAESSSLSSIGGSNYGYSTGGDSGYSDSSDDGGGGGD